MMFMFYHLLWALQIKGLPPLNRLVAIYLASNGALINDDLASPKDVPTRHVKLSAICEWMGCDQAELIDIIEQDLPPLGFTAVSVTGDDVHYSLPELPEQVFPAPRNQSEKQLSIYVIASSRGCTKIGISKLVARRALDLEAANPMDPLTIEFEARGAATTIRRIEKKVHAALAEHLIGNEWFQVPPSQAIEVVRAMLELAGLTK